MAKIDSPTVGADESDRINIDYIKSHLFRTISPNGILTSITPQGKIQFALFSERQAIPQRVVYKFGDDGTLGDVLETIGRDAIVREVEAVVTFDLETATSLLNGLSDMIKELRSFEDEEDRNDS
ncbi:hypothetical protein LB535_25130 [Mesorhizobium sp. CA10]|uniref:hypothetical protein n=1 Tax=Mesorhizobium sp. CA10 TaxID=588495 RepID=UPI001CCB6DF0|nr:hypothetical protein [Mesorhizobium sp. CA10]MBZ9885628.1 hypothetical protein [Mesorhizobium sp. CA10]